MKNKIYQGIYRFKEVKINEFCDMVFNGTSMVEGVIKEFALQKFRKGELVAYKEEGTNKVFIGFSACHPDDLKFYDKVTYRGVALIQADKCYDEQFYVDKRGVVGVPKEIEIDVAFFVRRVKLYFRDPEIPAWAEALYQKYCAE